MRNRLLFLFSVWILSACTDGFEDINKNPNSPETINSDYLMSNVVLSSAYYYQTQAFTGRAANAGRYITLVRNTDYTNFNWGPVGWWDPYAYLTLNYTLYQQAKEKGEDQYLAVAKIMKAFNFGYLSDLYGDIPYSQALQSKESGLTRPAYDKQEAIFPALLTELKEANELLQTTTKTIVATSDVLYAGNTLKWRKFANSLRLRYLLRISKNYPQAFTEMQEILGDKTKYPILESNADNPEIKYLGTLAANSWPGGTLAMIDFDFTKTKASKELVDRLTARNDPRLPVWVAPVTAATGATVDKNTYVGVPHAIADPASYNGGETHISTFSTLIRKNADDKLKASMLTYAEQCFILAEALQRKAVTFSGETAESLYYKGIDASMDYWGVKAQATTQGYAAQPLVKYDGTLEQLITQKWLANFFKGSEGWFDNRRTGYPVFQPGPLSLLSKMPQRFRYPDTETATNNENYKKAVAAFGADDEYTLMWYLK